jgi:LAO/AO transport system kinase
MTLVDHYRHGDVRALARLLTQVEHGDPAVDPLLAELASAPGQARIIGLTGPPGSGKSTLAGALVSYWRGQQRRVAVLAIDPSSPRSGGAALGDRVRLVQHATDAGVFIRSVASRGWPGGLAETTRAMVALLAGFGFDMVLVETVGVGQGEVAIAGVADLVVVTQAPGLGDEVQAIKAGLLELADIIVVTKGDLPGADQLARHLASYTRPADGAGPVVITTAATSSIGIDALGQLLDQPGVRREPASQTLVAVRRQVLDQTMLALRSLVARHSELDRLTTAVVAGQLSEADAVQELSAHLAQALATDPAPAAPRAHSDARSGPP